MVVTEDNVKRASLQFINAPSKDFRIDDYERFRAKFGISTSVCAIVMNMIENKLNSMPPDLFAKERRFFSLTHLMRALVFLKMYPTERQITTGCMLVGRSITRVSFRKWNKFTIRMIASLSSDVVRFRIVLVNYSLHHNN